LEEAVDTVKKCNIGKDFWYLLDKSSEYNKMLFSGYNYIFEVLLDEILKVTSEKNKDFPLKTFQYLVEKTYHYTPVTGELFLHHPLYFLNSLGSGYCDDVSSVFSIIMNKYGFKSEVHSLAGHVVSEVTNGNKKELFDVDLRCYYLNRKGEIASYQDLINDPDLIDKPITRLPGADTVAYSQYVRDYNKQYSFDEYETRFEVFTKNYDYINYHNCVHPNYKLNINQFADKTYEEYRSQLSNTKKVFTDIHHEYKFIGMPLFRG
jgi:hypothetical protein